MVDVTMLRPGDRVKIIDAWPGDIGQAENGNMDKWLGKYMTVLSSNSSAYFNGDYKPCVKMKEDQAEFLHYGWFWSSEMIDFIVPEEEESSIDLDLLFS